MKIITKEEMLNAPSGTVYTCYTPDVADGMLHIKVDNNCNLDLIPTFEFGDRDNLCRATNFATDDLNIKIDYAENELFAVFNKTEIMKMINCLSWALTDCKAAFDMDEVIYENNTIVNDPNWMPFD